MNYGEIESVVAVLRENPALTELEVRLGTRSLRLRRAAAVVGNAHEQKRTTAIADRSTAGSGAGNFMAATPHGNGQSFYGAVLDDGTPLGATDSSGMQQLPTGGRADIRTTVVANLVGVFRSNRQANLAIGSIVTEEQSLGQIEAMRLLNDCRASTSGRILAILVQDGEPVEYGQPLFELSRLEPSP